MFTKKDYGTLPVPGTKGNYRPVSLTSVVVCMLLESLIKDKISSHLMENNLIKDTEHGFMPRHEPMNRACRNGPLVQFMDVFMRGADFFYLASTRFSSKDALTVKKLCRSSTEKVNTGTSNRLAVWKNKTCICTEEHLKE